MAKSSKPVRSAGSALDMLVRQFAQPLACLRELVQNSIDAGSNQIEVTVNRDPDEPMFVIRVSDTGEGMTEEIIQTQLTRLFSSAKEGDLTKVGKFGIGFVSVFALNPTCVVVETGRQGQNWRILFKQDRTFELLRLSETVEGTCVTLYIPSNRRKLESFVQEVRDTLSFWCRHCRQQIQVNGQSIGQSFSLGSPFELAHEQPGTRLVLSASPEKEASFGYYNQGLTLLEGKGGPVPHLTFKMDSRYFEHTLTRDNVIQDADFEKAILVLKEQALRIFPARLMERLAQSDRPGEWELLDHLEPMGVESHFWERAPLFADHGGQRYSLEGLRGTEVYYQQEGDTLQEAVHQPQEGRVVLKLPQDHPGCAWLKRQKVKLSPLSKEWGLCAAEDQAEFRELSKVWSNIGPAVQVDGLLAVRWVGSPSPPFLFQARQAGAIRWSRSPEPKDLVLIWRDHPNCQQVLEIARWSPPLACQLLLQHLLLLRPELERADLAQRLTAAVLERI